MPHSFGQKKTPNKPSSLARLLQIIILCRCNYSVLYSDYRNSRIFLDRTHFNLADALVAKAKRMSPWEILGLNCEATAGEVHQAYEKLLIKFSHQDNTEGIRKIARAKKECLKRIHQNYLRLMNELEEVEPTDAEASLWKELNNGKVSGFLNSTTYDKSDSFVLTHWILKFLTNPINTVNSAHPPHPIDTELLEHILSCREEEINSLNWDEIIIEKNYPLPSLPYSVLSSLSNQTYNFFFQIWGHHHIPLVNMKSHYISFKRLSIDPRRDWIHHLNAEYQNDELKMEDILLLNFLYQMEAPNESLKNLCNWIEKIIMTFEVTDSTTLPPGPDSVIEFVEASDYVRFLLRTYTGSAQSHHHFTARELLSLPVQDNRLVKERDFHIDWFAFFQNKTFLIWLFLSLGLTLGIFLNSGEPQNTMLALAGSGLYFLITIHFSLKNLHSSQSFLSSFWIFKRAHQLTRNWCVSPPVVLDILEIKMSDRQANKKTRLHCSVLLQNFNRPSILSKWINTWSASQPLTNGPLRRQLKHSHSNTAHISPIR